MTNNNINILHVSDFHYRNKDINDQKIVVQALCKDIRDWQKTMAENVDLLVFSGDIVYYGSNTADFTNAKELLIDPVLQSANIDSDKVCIVPGNHDVNINEIEDWAERGLDKTLTSRSALNNFIDNHFDIDTNRSSPLLRLNNYEQFYKYLKPKAPLVNSVFVKTHIIDIRGILTGIACFNSAWRSTGSGENERGKMLVGERVVDKAVESLEPAKLKIAVLHHPFDWLQEFDRISVESQVYNHFDIILCGHTHRPDPVYSQAITGASLKAQVGCLYQNREYFNGYHIVAIDSDRRHVAINLRSYFDSPNRYFGPAVNIKKPDGILKYRLSENEKDDIERVVNKCLRDASEIIRHNANSHIRFAAGDDEELRITEHFVCPPLLERTSSGLRGVEPEEIDNKTWSPDDILLSERNFAICGRRESGRTSLAHFMAVKACTGVSDKPRVPVICDFAQLRRGRRPLRRLLNSLFGELSEDYPVEEFVRNGHVIVLLDNVDLDDKNRVSLLKDIIGSYDNLRFIFFAESRTLDLSLERRLRDISEDLLTLGIHYLPRRSIRQLSRNWASRTGYDEQRVFEAVMAQIRHAGLPRTAYIVSLLLWAIKRDRKLERLNEAMLLENMIDHLLQKADFRRTLRRDFDFKSQEWLLQELAVFFKRNGPILLYNDVLEHTVNLFRRKGFEFNAATILSAFQECGILRMSGEYVAFKYRCFQEFFVAGEMAANDTLFAEAMDGENYLRYYRELDLFSGRFRRQRRLADFLSSKAQELEPKRLRDFVEETFVEIGLSEPFVGEAKGRIDEMREPLSADEIDDLMDATERRMLEPESEELRVRESSRNEIEEERDSRNGILELEGDVVALSPLEKYARTLDLFGRVTRNLEFLDRDIKSEKLTEFFGAWSRMLLYAVHALESALSEVLHERSIEEDSEVGKEMRRIEYAAKIWMPIIFSKIMLDQTGTEKLLRVFEGIGKSGSSPLARRVFAAFLVLDLEPNRGIKLLKDLCEENDGNRYLVRLFVEKLFALYRTRPLLAAEQKEFQNFIADLEVRLGLPASRKGILISKDLRKKKYKE